ncbi:MAG: hypothetical protein ACHQAY_21560 [Hyphomicrobiales bacterium]
MPDFGLVFSGIGQDECRLWRSIVHAAVTPSPQSAAAMYLRRSATFVKDAEIGTAFG